MQNTVLMDSASNLIYVKAFNQGYLLAKYRTNLIEKIIAKSHQGIYFQGLNDGKNTFDKDLKLSRLKDIEKLRAKKSKDRGLER